MTAFEDEEDYADEDDNYVDSADERRTSVSRAAAGVSASYGDDEDDELMMGVEAEVWTWFFIYQPFLV